MVRKRHPYILLMIGAFLLFTGIDLGRGSMAFAHERPVKEFQMEVREKTIDLLKDPKKQVTVWAYGLVGEEATVPGPVIRVQVGDLVRVRFNNTHTVPHTIHFHGPHPFDMDGNGIRDFGEGQVQYPGETYTYEFMATKAGYFFYHCHYNTPTHIDHGMYGLFIVEDPAWPKADQEFLTFWDEWDMTGDGQYDTHTINTRSFPDALPLKATVGEKLRIVLANIGYQFHTPHLHGGVWSIIDSGDPRKVLANDRNSVVTVGPGEIKVVELIPEHEGTWLFHCHVVPHVADDKRYPRGMLTLLSVKGRNK